MIVWRKSSRSGGTTIQSDCVEVARLAGRRIGVRDSKNAAGDHLAFSVGTFATLVDRLKRDDLPPLTRRPLSSP